MKISFSEMHNKRKDIITHILDIKSKQSFRVVDVGGSASSWSTSIADVVVDINATRKEDYKFNICNENEWNNLLNDVNANGKFDYAICTHVIEDIANPTLLLRMLPKIAKSGIITAPCILTEISHIESPSWLGYIHHRYFVGFENDEILLAPKMGFLEKNVINNNRKDKLEIIFEWDAIIQYKMLMNEYLGPTVNDVVQEYTKFITEQSLKCPLGVTD